MTAWDTDEDDLRRNPKRSKVEKEVSDEEEEGMFEGLTNAVRDLTQVIKKVAEENKKEARQVGDLLSAVVLELKYGRFVPYSESSEMTGGRGGDEAGLEMDGQEGETEFGAEFGEEGEEQGVVEQVDDAEMQEPDVEQS